MSYNYTTDFMSQIGNLTYFSDVAGLVNSAFYGYFFMILAIALIIIVATWLIAYQLSSTKSILFATLLTLIPNLFLRSITKFGYPLMPDSFLIMQMIVIVVCAILEYYNNKR